MQTIIRRRLPHHLDMRPHMRMTLEGMKARPSEAQHDLKDKRARELCGLDATMLPDAGATHPDESIEELVQARAMRTCGGVDFDELVTASS